MRSPQFISISFVRIFSLLLYNFSTSPPFSPPHRLISSSFQPTRDFPPIDHSLTFFPQYHIHFPKRLFSTHLFNLLTLSNSLCLPLHVLYCIKIPCISQLLYFTTLYTFHSFQTSTRCPFILI